MTKISLWALVLTLASWSTSALISHRPNAITLRRPLRRPLPASQSGQASIDTSLVESLVAARKAVHGSLPGDQTPAKPQVSRSVVAAILLLLVAQNSGASLLTAAVRKTTAYDGAGVALLQEFGKVPIIVAAFAALRGRSGENVGSVARETFSRSALDLAFPSACFAVQVAPPCCCFCKDNEEEKRILRAISRAYSLVTGGPSTTPVTHSH